MAMAEEIVPEPTEQASEQASVAEPAAATAAATAAAAVNIEMLVDVIIDGGVYLRGYTFEVPAGQAFALVSARQAKLVATPVETATGGPQRRRVHMAVKRGDA